MTIELIKKQKEKQLKDNEYEVIYKGDWNDGDYLHSFDTVTESDFKKLVMWLDFFSKKDKLERGYQLDIRTDTYRCAINYFTDWLNENGYNYDSEAIEELAEYFNDDMCGLPNESSSGYGIQSLQITLKKDGHEYELGYTDEDVNTIIKEYLIGNCIIK